MIELMVNKKSVSKREGQHNLSVTLLAKMSMPGEQRYD